MAAYEPDIVLRNSKMLRDQHQDPAVGQILLGRLFDRYFKPALRELYQHLFLSTSNNADADVHLKPGDKRCTQVIRPKQDREYALPKRQLEIPDGKQPRRDPKPARERMVLDFYLFHTLYYTSS